MDVQAAWGLNGSTAAALHGTIGTRGCVRAGRVRTADHRIRKRGGLHGEALETRFFFNGYTAIPLGNAPWSVCRRSAQDVLKGAGEGGKDKGPRKEGERQGARKDAHV